jgi:uncharacterized protein (TIGR02594 family)
LFLTGCGIAQTKELDPSNTAQEYLGLNERQDRQELKELLDIDPVRTEWCAAFVNAILELEGIPSNNGHKYPLTARAFLDWGVSINPQDIQRGDIVVFPRGNAGWQGHVGFYVGRHTSGKWIILGGNQANSVRYDLYNSKRALGIRRYPNLGDTPGSMPKLFNRYE